MAWKLKQKLTDNSFLGDKVALRLANIPVKAELRVIDAFHGADTIWKNVQKKYDGSIKIFKIDKEQKDDSFVFPGDNKKYLSSLNLNNYDVVDLDAYGVPYDQLEIIFKKNYKGLVFITFIQNMSGCLPYDFLENLGYTKAMTKKCPTLFYKDGFKKMCAYLKLKGVEKIRYRTKNRKNYICFSMPSAL